MRLRIGGGFKAAGLLMPIEEFKRDHTKNGVVLHGTPSFENILSIARNGLYISKNGQGVAAVGPGVYTTIDKSTAESYAKESGIILEIPINLSPKLRVLDWRQAQYSDLITKIASEHKISPSDTETLFPILFKEYDIDIIINTHILIENSDAIRPPKNGIAFII